jgi:ATPase subunit of ABC transporter with duplicated ATPase domains
MQAPPTPHTCPVHHPRRFPEAGLKPEQMRAMLGRFGLEGQHHLTPIIKLSGGQKSRVVFTSISLQNPHILLLDEPTNHLDMQSIDALCDALAEFEGGVVVISHDSQLLSRLCDNEQSQVGAVCGTAGVEGRGWEVMGGDVLCCCVLLLLCLTHAELRMLSCT